MEIIFEFLFQIVAELLLDAGWHGAEAVLRSRGGRQAVMEIVGLGGGFLWSIHVAASGHVGEPRALWVSLVLAAVATLAAYSRHTLPFADRGLVGVRAAFVVPWRWPADRLAGLAWFNIAVAVGVLLGFVLR